MKATDLIELLRKLVQLHGDRDVKYDDSEYGPCDPEDIDLGEHSKAFVIY